jgi:hypothetical protein
MSSLLGKKTTEKFFKQWHAKIEGYVLPILFFYPNQAAFIFFILYLASGQAQAAQTYLKSFSLIGNKKIYKKTIHVTYCI